MAVLIPDTPGDRPHGERWVFDRFERDLDDDWVVLHSLDLVDHHEKLWGEIDFVVISTRGIFVIEVKGGTISCIDGKWKHERPGRKPYYRKEGPWRQAEGAMIALRDRLAKNTPHFADFLIGYGIIMPHAVFTAIGPEIESEVLIDKRTFAQNLGLFIRNLQHHWEQKYRRARGRIPKTPSRLDIRKIRQALRPDFESTFSLGSWFTGMSAEQVLLTNAQIKAARGAANNPRAVIEGRAGTGKTLVAIDRAKTIARAGEKVLYVCFNQLLARHVKLALQEDCATENIEVVHLHSLYRQAIREAGLLEKVDERDVGEIELFGKIYPEVFYEAAMTDEPDPVDVLIIDEAQDVMTPDNLKALDLLVHGGLQKGRWQLYLDPMQNIYGKASDDAQNILSKAGFFHYQLEENCRNTRQVAIQTSIISGIDMAIEGATDGPECDCVFYGDREDFWRKLHHELCLLRTREVSLDDIVILSTRRFENSMLNGLETVGDVRVIDLAKEEERDRGLYFSTMHRFKGLERKVVLAIDLERIGDPSLGMLHYAGLSRARGLLRPFVADADRALYEKQAQRYGERIAKQQVG